MNQTNHSDYTESMFCFQCEQTAGYTGCKGARGVCGKTAEMSALQNRTIGAPIDLAGAVNGQSPSVETDRLVMEGLFATLTNVNFDPEYFQELIRRIHEAKDRLSPMCSTCTARCGKSDDFDLNSLWISDEDSRSLRSLILFGLKGTGAGRL